MTPAVRKWAKKALAALSPGKVLEIGSLDVNGGIRDLLNGHHEYTGIDLVAGPGVDVVAEAAAFIGDEEWDAILSFDSLEHDPRWWDTAAAMGRGLRHGGTAIVTVPDIGYPRHHEPDYYRWTAQAASEALAPLTLVSIDRVRDWVIDEREDRDMILRQHATVWEKA